MALNDYLEDKVEVTEESKGVPFRRPERMESSLATVDSDIEQAQKAAQIRERREAIQQQITNLENQNAELRARLDYLKTLPKMDEDKIVAMAKAKGIKNEDIDAWLKGRAQRSAREISGAQSLALEKQAKELEQKNKDDDVQAIYVAEAEYSKALKEAGLSEDEAAATMDRIVLSAKNKLDTLKRNLQRRYGESWEKFTEEDKKTPAAPEAGSDEDKDKDKVEVILTDEEAKNVDEKTMQKFNEPDTTNKQKREIKAEAQKKIREKSEASEARAKKLNEMRGHLKTLGISKETNVMKALLDAQKTTDPMIRRALDEVTKFLRSDKDYKTYSDLKKLLK